MKNDITRKIVLKTRALTMYSTLNEIKGDFHRQKWKLFNTLKILQREQKENSDYCH